jgi:hypothetical protein
MNPIRLSNESALGVYVMSWIGGDDQRFVLSWTQGWDEPLLEFYSHALGRMTLPQPVQRPERFGWKPPKTITDYKKFALRVAEAMEAEYALAQAEDAGTP